MNKVEVDGHLSHFSRYLVINICIRQINTEPGDGARGKGTKEINNHPPGTVNVRR